MHRALNASWDVTLDTSSGQSYQYTYMINLISSFLQLVLNSIVGCFNFLISLMYPAMNAVSNETKKANPSISICRYGEQNGLKLLILDPFNICDGKNTKFGLFVCFCLF